MKITQNTVVTLHMKVSDAQGRTLDDGKTPMSYLHGGYENVFPRLEAALDGQEPGFQATLDLAPEEAFGVRDESLLQTMPKNEFPPGVKVGGQIQQLDATGNPRHFFVVKIKGPVVMLDGNHPLAGTPLRFALKVLDVREATAEEIAHRHVHGEHGHQH